jgi:hypothetical protein
MSSDANIRGIHGGTTRRRRQPILEVEQWRRHPSLDFSS